MYENNYLHSTGGYLGYYLSKKNILKILNDGMIKPVSEIKDMKHKSKILPSKSISLCDPNRTIKDANYKVANSSFEQFICYGPSIVLNKNFKVFTPIYSNKSLRNSTDLYDEVRHKGSIILDDSIYITFPISYDMKRKDNLALYDLEDTKNKLKIYYEIIKEIETEFPSISLMDLNTNNYIDSDFVKEKIYTIKK